MTDWVLAAERAYVAAAVAGRVAGPAAVVTAERQARAIAAAFAIASRFLAVGTPRSFGLVIEGPGAVAEAALALVAHRTWFQPRDIRCAAAHGDVADLVAATGGRAVSVAEALACDIACVHGAYVRIAPADLRRGSHLNVTWAGGLDGELHRIATVVREAGLPALAAGLVDGRQLDEITIFVADAAPIAAAVV